MGKKAREREERERKARSTFRTTITGLGAGIAFLVVFGVTGGDAEAASAVIPAGGGVVLGVEQIVYQNRQRRDKKVNDESAARLRAIAESRREAVIGLRNQLRLKRAVFNIAEGEELPPRLRVAREVADEALRLESPDLASLQVAIQVVDRQTAPQSITSPEIDIPLLSRFMTQNLPSLEQLNDDAP